MDDIPELDSESELLLSLKAQEAGNNTDETKSLAHLYDISVYENEKRHALLYTMGRISIMDALVKYFRWFTEHPGISKEALSDILKMEHEEVLVML